MDFNLEKPIEVIPDEKENLAPIKSLRSDPPPQYFTNINSVYCKDVAGRGELDELKALVDDVPWQPLQDGYSNFWFELTNDTLSPWLNFSAKTENAVIDWGDGSGEVALDTLTPTHTYAKAGRYVVKVKGVTGIGAQYGFPLPDYISVIEYIEFSSEIATIGTAAFRNTPNIKAVSFANAVNINSNAFQSCANLKKVIGLNTDDIVASMFYMCISLRDITIPSSTLSIGNSAFSYCLSLSKITIPENVTSIGNSAFATCASLSEVHCQPTSPPTLGTNVFNALPSNWLCYVPVGYGDTYKSATGWSTYADHILEEGQTPNRMMLAKFKEETDEPQDDMR